MNIRAIKLHWSLKLLISIILILLLFWKFPVREIIENCKQANFMWMLLAFLLGELIIVNQAFRWHYLLIVPQEQKPQFSILLKYTVIGYFFNLLAPGGIGGDAYRSVALGRAHNVIAGSVTSIFVARIFGLVALCLLYWLSHLFLPDDFRIPKYVNWFMIFATAFLIVFCITLAFNKFQKGKVGSLAQKLREYKKYPSRLVAAMFGSLAMQVLVVFMQFAVFKAVGISAPLSLIFAIVPVTLLLTTIPISFNGIGVREWSMLSLTPSLNSEQILAGVFLGYAVIILQALQGWLAFVFKKG